MSEKVETVAAEPVVAVPAVREEKPQAIGLTLWEQARVIAGTDVVPPHLRGKPDAVLAVVLKGREIGLGFMAALNAIVNISGKYTLDSQTMLAIALRRVPGADVAVIEETEDSCTVEASRPGRKPFRVTWTMAQATAAGLTTKTSWKSYKRAMLRWRCIAEACRVMFPDAISGMYPHEEMGAEVDEEGRLVAMPSTVPATPQRSSASQKASEAANAAAAPAVTGEVLIAEGQIEDVQSKSGATNGKPWTRYGVKLCGLWVGTFDSKLADLAKELREQSIPATVRYVEGKRGKDIVEIAAAMREPGEE